MGTQARPYPPPPPPPSLTVAAAEGQVRSIIETIVGGGGYAQFSLVLSMFLSQNNVVTVQDLGHPSLPTLDLLLALEKKVHAFVSIHLATHDVVSLLDLEVEVVRLLGSFNIPTLSELWQSLAKDQNEVDVDHSFDIDQRDVLEKAVSGEGSAASSSSHISLISLSQSSVTPFQIFGIGPLQKHPLLVHHLPVALKTQLGGSEVHKHLISYLV